LVTKSEIACHMLGVAGIDDDLAVLPVCEFRDQARAALARYCELQEGPALAAAE
jgi:hypothetical protein